MEVVRVEGWQMKLMNCLCGVCGHAVSWAARWQSARVALSRVAPLPRQSLCLMLCIFVPAPDLYAHAGEVVPDDAAQHIVT